MQARKTKKEIEGERTRAQILDEAVVLFSARGYRATSVAMIAKACSISTATVFWHFESKEGLLQAIFNRMFEELQQIMAEKQTGEHGPRALPTMTASEFDYFTEHTKLMRMLLGLILEADAMGGRLNQLVKGLLHSYLSLLAAQLRKSYPSLTAAEARERATLFVASLAGIIVLRVADEGLAEPAAMVEVASRFLLDVPEKK